MFHCAGGVSGAGGGDASTRKLDWNVALPPLLSSSRQVGEPAGELAPTKRPAATKPAADRESRANTIYLNRFICLLSLNFSSIFVRSSSIHRPQKGWYFKLLEYFGAFFRSIRSSCAAIRRPWRSKFEVASLALAGCELHSVVW